MAKQKLKILFSNDEQRQIEVALIYYIDGKSQRHIVSSIDTARFVRELRMTMARGGKLSFRYQVTGNGKVTVTWVTGNGGVTSYFFLVTSQKDELLLPFDRTSSLHRFFILPVTR